MSTPNHILWQVSHDNLLAAVEWSCKKLFYSIDRPNMNPRGLTESLDDKIMGDVATVAVVEYMRQKLYIPTVAYDMIRINKYQEPDPGWDIAFGKNAYSWGKETDNPKSPIDLITASVRSSRLVKFDNIQQAIMRRDFKIFVTNAAIETCITADIEMQVYYDYSKSQLGDRRVTQALIEACINTRDDCGEIVRILEIEQRFGQCYLTAWNTKDRIVNYSRSLQDRYWDSFGKKMWLAPLKLGNSFPSLKELV